MKNLLVAQSGGPTSAINATLAGVIENALSSPSVDKIYGSVNGIQGVLIMRCDSDSGKKLIKSMVLRTADRQGMC